MTESKPSSIADAFVRTRRHGRMHLRRTGSGPAIVLSHSNGGSAYQFDAVAEQLAAHFDVISWTMPGHGDSDPIGRHYTIDDYAEAIVDLLDALDIGRAHVAGSSVGGSIAAAFGADYAARALSVVMAEMPCRTYAEWGARWPHTEGNFGIPTQDEATIRTRVANPSPADVTRWNLDRNKAGARVMVDVMWAIREFDVRAAVARVACPALIVYGGRGPNVNDRARLEAAAPRIPVEVLDGSGHFPMLDVPQAFASLLERFCREHGPVTA